MRALVAHHVDDAKPDFAIEATAEGFKDYVKAYFSGTVATALAFIAMQRNGYVWAGHFEYLRPPTAKGKQPDFVFASPVARRRHVPRRIEGDAQQHQRRLRRHGREGLPPPSGEAPRLYASGRGRRLSRLPRRRLDDLVVRGGAVRAPQRGGAGRGRSPARRRARHVRRGRRAGDRGRPAPRHGHGVHARVRGGLWRGGPRWGDRRPAAAHDGQLDRQGLDRLARCPCGLRDRTPADAVDGYRVVRALFHEHAFAVERETMVAALGRYWQGGDNAVRGRPLPAFGEAVQRLAREGGGAMLSDGVAVLPRATLLPSARVA